MIDEIEVRYIAYRNKATPCKKGKVRQWVKYVHTLSYYDYEPGIGNPILTSKCGCDVRFMPRITGALPTCNRVGRM